MIDYVNIEKEDLYDTLKELEPFDLAAHHDADGVYSAVLLSKVFEIDNIEFPLLFGDYSSEQVAVDIGQSLDEDWDGVIFDHHPHTDLENAKYKLVKGNMPTGGVVLEALKDHIDPKWSWLAAGAYVGDGQSALIPPEVFEEHKSLLEARISIYESYNKISTYQYPLYSLLSSPINATCRTNKPYNAYRILKTCTTPDQVVTHPVFKADQQTLTGEINKLVYQFGKDKKNRRSGIVIGNFIVLPFESEYRIASRFATKIGVALRGKTVICINQTTGAMSIRGDLAYWLLKKMVPLGWTMGGHAGYCGGSLSGDQDVESFLSDLRTVIY